MSEKKKQEQDGWFEQHSRLKWLIFFVSALPYAVVIAIASYGYGILNVLSVDALRATIEAEATIIGFFAIVVAYLLNSYDLRIDRFEQELFDMLIQNPQRDAGPILITGSLQKAVKERKKKTVFAIVIVGVCLAISLFLLIIALAFVSLLSIGSNSSNKTLVGIAFITDALGTVLLFTGTYGIFSFLLGIAREREPKDVEEWRDTLMKSYQPSKPPLEKKS
jgi:magnesium-transporting ATPase (P-type)